MKILEKIANMKDKDKKLKIKNFFIRIIINHFFINLITIIDAL